jgi:hypothetical protein
MAYSGGAVGFAVPLFFQGYGLRLKSRNCPAINLSLPWAMFALTGWRPIRRFPVGLSLPRLHASERKCNLPASITWMEQGPKMPYGYHGSLSLRKLINSASYATAAFLTFACFLRTQSRNGNI